MYISPIQNARQRVVTIKKCFRHVRTCRFIFDFLVKLKTQSISNGEKTMKNRKSTSAANRRQQRVCLGDQRLFAVGIKAFIDNTHESHLDKKGGH